MMNLEIQKLEENLKSVISGKSNEIELLLTAILAGGHVLMEDVPGVGKTTLAKALARSIHGNFHRVQFTPDLLPSDIIGASVYNPRDGAFVFRKGPVFTNILLADEINRASPRTQSALLEAMNEGQVTAENTTYPLDSPFLVIATENPIEYYGTYPLPEAQLDRFAIQITMGYPDEKSEFEMLYSRMGADPLTKIQPVISCEKIVELQSEVRKVGVEKSVSTYMISIIRQTREDARIRLGASPRALLTLFRCAQARAFILGRNFVTPDDIKKIAVHVLAHRIVLDNKTKYSGISKKQLLSEILEKIEPPL